MATDEKPNVKILTISEPVENEEATVDAGMMGSGYLCSASGQTIGSQVAEVITLVEPLESEASEPTLTCGEVKMNGQSANFDYTTNDWEASSIPDAQCSSDEAEKWNALHVCTFYYGFPPAPTYHETVKFKGVCGTCGYGGRQSRLIQQLQANGQGELKTTAKQLIDLVGAWWTSTINPVLLREPAERDGDWMLYRNLPVDIAFGATLALDGNPLRSTCLSMAVERYRLRRKLKAPVIQTGSPTGSGLLAINGGGMSWRFPGYPAFAVFAHEQGSIGRPESTQMVSSLSREQPTTIYTDNRPIRIAINSPRTEDPLNEGVLDLWVRVNAG